MARDFWL